MYIVLVVFRSVTFLFLILDFNTVYFYGGPPCLVLIIY